MPDNEDPHLTADEQLEKMISETEQALAELRAELSAHRAERDREEALDQMPQLMDVTKARWRNVGVFISELTSEMKSQRESPHRYVLRDDSED
ncbi:hypothetical protein [Corynebacterium sputi]|uniref:hypothetical protein n=1 Tax=Corynebacterium sputi TaxID=489915 RepID=UPI000407561D|nr:hypothetical protein [Corynebacterium sputi]